MLFFISHNSCRLLAAFLEGFISLRQSAYDDEFSCTYESSVTKVCPKLKIGKIGENQENALRALVTFTVLIKKENNRCQQGVCTSNNSLTVRR